MKDKRVYRGNYTLFPFSLKKNHFFSKDNPPKPFISRSTALKQVIPYEKCFFILNPMVFAHIRRFKTLFPPY